MLRSKNSYRQHREFLLLMQSGTLVHLLTLHIDIDQLSQMKRHQGPPLAQLTSEAENLNSKIKARGWFHKLVCALRWTVCTLRRTVCTLRRTVCTLRPIFEKLFTGAKVWPKAQNFEWYPSINSNEFLVCTYGGHKKQQGNGYHPLQAKRVGR